MSPRPSETQQTQHCWRSRRRGWEEKGQEEKEQAGRKQSGSLCSNKLRKKEPCLSAAWLHCLHLRGDDLSSYMPCQKPLQRAPQRRTQNQSSVAEMDGRRCLAPSCSRRRPNEFASKWCGRAAAQQRGWRANHGPLISMLNGGGRQLIGSHIACLFPHRCEETSFEGAETHSRMQISHWITVKTFKGYMLPK